MPFNGSGTFLRVRNWVNDATAGIKIRADRHDSEDDNLASGLSQCITKDGQTTVTANLPMATYRHTNVGAATATTDYARFDQVQLGKGVWAVAGGTADAITATYSPATTAPADGQLYYVRATAANMTATPTFAPDGQTARTITKFGNKALGIGDIYGAGQELILRYRTSDTKYEWLNANTSINGATSATITATDEILFDDVSDSNNVKKDTVQGILNLIFPVGSIYSNASVSTNPATLLGFGTWVAVGVDRVLIGVGSTYPTAGATGGAATQTLSVSNLPAHSHTFNGVALGSAQTLNNTEPNLIPRINAGSTSNVSTSSQGSGTAFSIVQPYEVVYMWKRTA
jgi:hypothetical protein